MEKNHKDYKVLVQKEVEAQGYIYEKVLGEGQFGMVVKAQKDGMEFAVKAINKQQFLRIPKLKELTRNEIKVLKNIKNQNIICMYEHFESEINHYLVTEFCNNGDMGTFIWKLNQKKQFLGEIKAIEYFTQILNGFQALHERSIVHRDIKLDNIFRHQTSQGNILKIGDLGFAKQLKDSQSLTTTALGTSITKAPEVIEKKPYGLEADLYSCGVILYQLIFGCYPYVARQEKLLLPKVKAGNLNFQVNGIQISQEAKDLITRMLKYDRRQRITWGELYEHPLFMKPNVNNILVKSMGGSSIQNLVRFYDQQQILLSYQLEGFYKNTKFTKIIDGKKDGQTYCIKEIRKDQLMENKKLEESFMLMVDILQDEQSKNHNIIQIIEFKESEDSFFLIQEFCSQRSVGYQIERRRKKFTEIECLEILLQILNGFKFLHSKNIIHRNIQADHVLLQEGNIIKLIGLKSVKKIDFENDIIAQSCVGQDQYISPEVNKQQAYDYTADIHSLGILMYYMLFSQYPYKGKSREDILKFQQNQQQINFNTQKNVQISPLMQNLIQRMIQYQSKDRIKYNEIYQHPIFKVHQLQNQYNFKENLQFYLNKEIQKIQLPGILIEKNISLQIESLNFQEPPKILLLNENASGVRAPPQPIRKNTEPVRTKSFTTQALQNPEHYIGIHDDDNFIQNLDKRASIYISKEANIHSDIKKISNQDDMFKYKVQYQNEIKQMLDSVSASNLLFLTDNIIDNKIYQLCQYLLQQNLIYQQQNKKFKNYSQLHNLLKQLEKLKRQYDSEKNIIQKDKIGFFLHESFDQILKNTSIFSHF